MDAKNCTRIAGVAAVLLVGACSFGPTSTADLCTGYRDTSRALESSGPIQFGKGGVFRELDELGDLADGYQETDLSREADALHQLADSAQISGYDVDRAVGRIPGICGTSS